MADQFKPTLAGLARKCFGEKKKEKRTCSHNDSYANIKSNVYALDE